MRKIYFLLIFILAGSYLNGQAPEGYYSTAESLTGEELKTALYHIIKGHTEYPYTSSGTDTWDILKEADRDPDNPDNVLGIYSGFSIPAQPEYNGGDGWTREHVWAKSRGDFGTDMGAGTDVHHLRAEDNSTNTARSNRNFAESNEPFVDESGTYQGTTGSYTGSGGFTWEPRAAVKGDVARMIFYMATRYEGEGDEPDLEIVDSLLTQSEDEPVHSRLYDLIAWHKEDPVDENEQNRNEIIYGYQENRNPFIDHPEWVTAIWGDPSAPKVELNKYGFNDDFGAVEVGESLVQRYFINAYYLTEELTVAVDPPFYVSKEEAGSYSGEVTFTSGEKITDNFQVYLKFEPQQSGGNDYSAEVAHTSAGMQSVKFTVTGEEGERAAVLTIAEARNRSLGTRVSVTGVVIDKGNNSSRSRVIFDGTAGIVIRSPEGESNETGKLVYGDSVVVSGGLSEYNGLLQIEEAPVSIQLISSGAEVEAPQVITLSEIGEDQESELVTVNNVNFEATGTFMGGGSQGNFTVTDGEKDFIFRLGSSAHPLVATPIPTGQVNITGIIGQFGDDYQISPRSIEDLEVHAGPLGALKSYLELTVRPNPTSNVLHFRLPSGGDQRKEVQVMDMNGRVVKSCITKKSKIDVSRLNSGGYIMVITIQGNFYYSRFIKE